LPEEIEEKYNEENEKQKDCHCERNEAIQKT
jgi:hypothetical protein